MKTYFFLFSALSITLVLPANGFYIINEQEPAPSVIVNEDCKPVEVDNLEIVVKPEPTNQPIEYNQYNPVPIAVTVSQPSLIERFCGLFRSLANAVLMKKAAVAEFLGWRQPQQVIVLYNSTTSSTTTTTQRPITFEIIAKPLQVERFQPVAFPYPGYPVVINKK